MIYKIFHCDSIVNCKTVKNKIANQFWQSKYGISVTKTSSKSFVLRTRAKLGNKNSYRAVKFTGFWTFLNLAGKITKKNKSDSNSLIVTIPHSPNNSYYLPEKSLTKNENKGTVFVRKKWIYLHLTFGRSLTCALILLFFQSSHRQFNEFDVWTFSDSLFLCFCSIF